MMLFSNPLILLGLLVVILLHIPCSILPSKIGKILNIVNICLHIALIALMICTSIPFDECVLSLMLSALCYLIIQLISDHVAARRGGGHNDEDIDC